MTLSPKGTERVIERDLCGPQGKNGASKTEKGSKESKQTHTHKMHNGIPFLGGFLPPSFYFLGLWALSFPSSLITTPSYLAIFHSLVPLPPPSQLATRIPMIYWLQQDKKK